MKRFFTRAAALALALLLTVQLTPLAHASVALGDDLSSGTVGLAPGSALVRNIFWSSTYSDLRTERYITYKPTTGVFPKVVYGDKVLTKQSLTTMAKSLEKEGYRVVGGINGDFFDMSTGNTLGVVISDGLLRSTAGGFYGIGFMPDGSAFIGWPGIAVTATFLGNTIQITDLNKTRTALTGTKPGGYYLYTNDYSKTTQHTSPGVDVILTPVTTNTGKEVQVDLDVSGSDGKPVTQDQDAPQTAQPVVGSDSGNLQPGDTGAAHSEVWEVSGTLTQSAQLSVGSRITCTVDQVLESTGSIDIPAGKMVMTINKQNNQWLVDQLLALKPGDTLDIDVTSADERWSQATTALGGFYRIVTNGQVGPHTDKVANPRTAIGVKADGTVLFYAIDGKQPGYSVGATLNQVAQRMIELGCVDVIGMDGGGSTMMGGTLPFNSSMELLNRPSDGSQRAVSTGIFLVSNLKATGQLNHFYVTPYDSMLLAQASIPLKANAMDTSYYAMPYSDEIFWSIRNGDGTVSADGVFSAGGESGTTLVTATAGTATGDAAMTVVKTPDTISVGPESGGSAIQTLALEPNQKFDLKASATYRKLPLVSQDTCYTWSADTAIGTVDKDGVLTAGPKSGVGTLTVSAGGRSVAIPVAVAGRITEVDGFEAHANSLTGTGTVTVAPETASDYVRFGSQSAKLTYDTAAAGTAAVATTWKIAAGERFLSLWVYGDGSGNALTATVADAAGQTSDVVLTGLDFTGWKQVMVELPANAAAVRTLNIVGGGTAPAGGLWLDQVTTTNERFIDTNAPAVTVALTGTALTATVTDNVDKKFTDKSVVFTVDGKVYPATWNAAKNALTATLPAADGKQHRLTVTATDQSGNIGRASADSVPAKPSDSPFADMAAHWAKPYTTYLYHKGVTNGVDTVGGKFFKPDDNITRGEFALMVARWMGLDLAAYGKVELPFADTAQIPAWCLNGIKAMYAEGIMKGSNDGGTLQARASTTISRAEAMTILGRVQPKGHPQKPLAFGDAAAVPAWSLAHVESLVAQGVITGFENQLRPTAPVKRCEVAKMLYSIL